MNSDDRSIPKPNQGRLSEVSGPSDEISLVKDESKTKSNIMELPEESLCSSFLVSWYLSYAIRIKGVPPGQIVALLGVVDDLNPAQNTGPILWGLKGFHRLGAKSKFSLLRVLEDWSKNHILCPEHLVFHSKNTLCSVTQPETARSFQELALSDPMKAWHILRVILHSYKYGPWLGIPHPKSEIIVNREFANWKLLIWPFSPNLHRYTTEKAATISDPSALSNSGEGSGTSSEVGNWLGRPNPHSGWGMYTLTHGIHRCEVGSGCDHSWTEMHTASSLICPHAQLWYRDIPQQMGSYISLEAAVRIGSPSSVLNDPTAKTMVWSRYTRHCKVCLTRYDWLAHVVDGIRWVYVRRLTYWGTGEDPWKHTWMKPTYCERVPLELQKRDDIWRKGFLPLSSLNARRAAMRTWCNREALAQEDSACLRSCHRTCLVLLSV